MPKLSMSKAAEKAGIREICFHDKQQGVYICRVQLDKCVVDTAYQRKHDEKHSDRMMASALKVYPYPIINYHQGKLNVLDGQHRIQSLLKRNVLVAYAVIAVGLTVQESAAIYAGLNTMKRPNPWNQFKARLTARSPEHLDMMEIAAKYGFELKCENTNAELRCTDTLTEAYQLGIFEKWIKVLDALRDNDGVLNKRVRMNSIEFQRGLIDFVHRYPKHATSKPVLAAIRQIGANTIADEADTVCECARTSRSSYYQALRSLLGHWGVIPVAYPAAA